MDNIQLLANVLSSNIDAFPTTCLGLPLSAKFKEKTIRDFIIGKSLTYPTICRRIRCEGLCDYLRRLFLVSGFGDL